MHTVETVRGSHVRLFEDDAVKCNSCGREGVIQTCDGIATVLWETDAERAEGAAMTKSTPTRDELNEVVATYGKSHIVHRMAKQLLVAMDSEPVAEVLSSRPGNDTSTIDRALPVGTTLYLHAQQPVVPDDVLDALQKVARIRLDLNGFDGDRRGIADCLCDAEEALIEVVNRRAAMLQGAENAESRCGIQTAPALDSFKKNSESRCGNSPVIPDGYRLQPISEYEAMCATVNSDEWPQRWIPVSERMPEDRTQVILWDAEIGEVTSGHYSHKTHTFYHCGDAIQNEITHWMPLPADPQEVNHG